MQTLNEYLAGRSKKDFAASVNIAPAYLSQLLGGMRNPSFPLMLRIREATAGKVGLESWAKVHDNKRGPAPAPAQAGQTKRLGEKARAS